MSSNSVETFQYPKHINSDGYSNRKVTITVVQPDTSVNGVESIVNALDKAKNLAKDAESYVQSNGDVKKAMNILNKNKNSKLVGNTESIIVLPLPNTFTDQQAHEWSTTSSPVGELLKDFTDTKIFGASLDNSLGWAASHVGARKPVADPGYFQNYTGSTPRGFNMSFDFIPDSEEEANMIIQIIMRLKQYSSPSRLVGGVALMAPYYFNVQFSNDYINAMAKLDYCVLSNITVDYGADGNMQQTHDGFPKHIVMSLAFQELHMTTMEDYNTVPSTTQKGHDVGATVAGAK